MVNEGPVTLHELLHTLAIPPSWAATFVYSGYWWVNQEDGYCDGRRPHWVDVEAFLWGAAT